MALTARGSAKWGPCEIGPSPTVGVYLITSGQLLRSKHMIPQPDKKTGLSNEDHRKKVGSRGAVLIPTWCVLGGQG